MPQFLVQGTRPVKELVEATTYRQALRKFKDDLKADPIVVDIRDFCDFDVKTGEPILTGDEYESDFNEDTMKHGYRLISTKDGLGEDDLEGPDWE